MLVIYSVVFKFVFRNNIDHYPIYLFIMLMPWNAFNSMIMNGSTCVSNNASIIKKVYFPREVLPLSVVISYTIQYCFSLIVTIIASAANVYVRDVQYMMNPIMMIWMYASPILYSISMVPEKFLSIYKLNPMVTILGGYKSILYDKTLPDFRALGIVFLVSLGLCVIGWLVFNKLQRRLAEEV